MHQQPTSASTVSVEHLTLGRAIRELRARRAIAQEQLGFRSGLHRNYVGTIERGEVSVTFRTLLAVARGLDLPLSTVVALYERRLAERNGSVRVGGAHSAPQGDRTAPHSESRDRASGGPG
jgi:transcriptional regulator with XRE-family HTH domain